MKAELLRVAGQRARAVTKKGWTVQMVCSSDTDATVLVGIIPDGDLDRAEGVRVTASLVRTANGIVIDIKHKLI